MHLGDEIINLKEGVPGMKWGGGSALLLKVKALILMISGMVELQEVTETIVLAALGATVGFFVHLFWTILTKKFKKKKEKK